MEVKRYHIITRGKGWALLKESNSQATGLYDKKEEAIVAAEKYRAKGFDVIVHKTNGSVEKWKKAKCNG
jgi:hypothetical protein